ncbi:Aldehyde/histidinol dehydrogenase, partial [Microdochium bolleyi]
MSNLPFTLNDPTLLHEASLLGGKWVQANSGNRFDVEDPGTCKVWASCANNDVADVDQYVESSQAAYAGWRHTNPRERAKVLMRWHELITAARDDIAALVVHETGKPMAEAQGEVDYANGFAWWFAGEAERVRGSVAQPSVS